MVFDQFEGNHCFACAGRMDDCCHTSFIQHGDNCLICFFVMFEKVYAHLVSQIVIICESGFGPISSKLYIRSNQITISIIF